MDELLELIESIGSDNPPTADELNKARGELVDLLKVATAAETRDLESAAALREAIDSIDTEITARAEAAEKEEAEARRLLEGLEEPAAEDEAEESEETEDETAEAREPEPVAASRLGSRNLGTAVRRTSARMTTDSPDTASHTRALTLGPAQAENLGVNPTMREVARVFDRAAGRVKTRGAKEVLLRIEHDYPENRRLFGSDKVDNDRLLDTVLSPQAIAAAGGICDPLPADFTHPILGVRGRPIRDALPRFQASRGGVRFSPTATLAAVSGAVGLWDYETDTSPGEDEKDCLVLECEDEVTAHVDAITACLQIGNFQARFNPEFWRSRLDLLMVAHDRMAEQTLFTDMVASATAVTYGAGSGTIYSVLSGVSKAAAGLRSRLRLRDATLRMVAPAWLRDALRDDIASQRLGSSPAEALTVADNVINSFFSARRINPVWSPDLEIFGAQNAGALVDYPNANVQMLLYPEGTYFFMDGGTLDLGTEIYDSELIRQNNRMAFMETFEKAVFRGGQALALTVPISEECVCPDVLMGS